jgi:hypothetical protein
MRQLDLSHVARWAEEIRAMTDDTETFLDTLDGQTDAINVLRRVVLARAEAAAQEQATKDLANTYRERAARLAARQERLSVFLGEILDAIGEAKVALDVATVARTKGQPKVEVVDESEIPTQLTRIKRSPDLVAIKAALKSGEEIPGCRLTAGTPSITVRIK